MMTDEAQPPSSSSSDTNVPLPEPDPPPNVKMSSIAPTQTSQPQSRTQSTGTSDENQSSSPNSSSTPPLIKWSRGLSSLLDDQQGRDLFERYLDQEGCSAQLTFLWACEGLKCTATDDPPKIPQLVRSIHRHFFQNIVLHGISDTTRSDLAQVIIEGRFSEVGLFDKAEEEVRKHMEANLYPNFLKSEILRCAVNGEDDSSSNLQEQLEYPAEALSSSGRKLSVGDASSIGSGSGAEQKSNFSTALTVDVEQKSGSEGQSPKIPSPPLSTAPTVLLPNQLQTVHEDAELSVNPQQAAANQHNSKLKLTKEALHLTQLSRASVPVAPSGNSVPKIRSREAFTSHFHQKPSSSSTGTPLHPYHASYSSYNPVSRVDSEIQSMSSDAMTDDGTHSGHGHSSRKHGAHHHSSRNKGHQLPSSSSSHLYLHQGAHSSGDARRQMLHSGILVDNRDNLPKYPPGIVKGARAPNREAESDPKAFATLLIRKLEEVKRQREIDEKFHQKINLDDHVGVQHNVGVNAGPGGGGMEEITPNVLAAAINRLQVQDDGLPDDILDKHMSRVFSDITPDNRSPKLRSPTPGRRRGGPSGLSIRPRLERDVISTFSGDSGNVHDYSSDTLPSMMPKSRSIPSELRISDHGGFASGFGASQRGRFIRGGGLGHGDSRNAPKRTSSEFLDSGISVLSGATVISAAQPPPLLPSCDRPDLRVAQWMEQCPDDRSRPRPTLSPPMMRSSKKPVRMPHSSHMMPPTATPTTTLEEVRRRLSKRTTPLPNATQSIQIPFGPMSSASTSGLRHHSPSSSDESSSATNREHSVSSFVFYEDSSTAVPYCVKIPYKTPSVRSGPGSSSSGCGITLAVFKRYLPKPGNYRYFFKRECEEVDTKVVQEEITDDCQELPLHEGKIIAHLQPL